MDDLTRSVFATRQFAVNALNTHVDQTRISAPQPTAIIWCTRRAATGPAPEPLLRSVTMLRAGMGQWLLVSEHDAASVVLGTYAAAAPDFCLTDISHARSRLRIHGPAARDVLQSGIALDLEAGSFPVGTGAITPFRDIPVLVHARDEDEFDLYVFRSYAKTLSQWLLDNLAI